MIWPIAVAPFHIALVALRGGEEQADQIYRELTEAGFEVLLDDRDETPGVKFADADLIGLPVRLTVSKRSLEKGGVELKLRRDTDSRVIPLDGVVGEVQAVISSLRDEISAMVVEVPFKA